jgi:hypothetical protein
MHVAAAALPHQRTYISKSTALPSAGSDCFLLESIFEAEVWAYMCQPVSASNEAAVCAAMMDGAREALARYSSSIDEDLALLRDGGVVAGSRQDMAVQVRLAGTGWCAHVKKQSHSSRKACRDTLPLHARLHVHFLTGEFASLIGNLPSFGCRLHAIFALQSM